MKPRVVLNRKKVNPSQLIFTGVKRQDQTKAQLFVYGPNFFKEEAEFDFESLEDIPKDENNYWLNLHGIHEPDKVKTLCDALGIHNLTIQDILDVNQRPKFQEFENYVFFSSKSMLPSAGVEIETEQMSFVLGSNYLISFQEEKRDHFDHVRNRIRENIGIVRERGVDYLLFLLYEAILDNYFTTLSNIDKIIDEMDLANLDNDPSPEVLNAIELQKRNVSEIKKTLLPLREFVMKIERENLSFIQPNTIKYYYELKDLCLTLLDTCDHLNLRLESGVNLFFSVQGQRMNQIMKTLTVVSTVFIPLTFIAGIYGMNFVNMPELQWHWGYYGVWVVMLLMVAAMMRYFRKRKWF